MHPHLRDRILKKLETLGDERAYQVLDYAEFLESKYAAPNTPQPSLLDRFTDGVEGTLRAGKVSANAVAETMSLLNKAMGVLGGVAEAGKSVASSAVGVAQGVAAAGKSVASELRTAGQKSEVKGPSNPPEPTSPLPPQPGESEPG
ncbi:MAG: hypothetical protein ACT4P6_03785 [Gemmatimonadaceae bacterium]